MRYYSINVTDLHGKAIKGFPISSLAPGFMVNQLGSTNMGALNVELDVPVTMLAVPSGAAYVKVWGVSLQQISQSADLNGMNIQVFAGMANGLPLAKPGQSGLLIQGTILQAFGNWMGTDQTLDIVIVPTYTTGANSDGQATPQIGTPNDPVNITWDCPAGSSLSDSLAATLERAGFSVSINISQNLVVTQDDKGFHGTVAQFATHIKILSQDINRDPTYPGIDMFIRHGSIIVADGTKQTTPKEIAFSDLIGQPTWLSALTIQVNCVMRADINVGDYVKLPPFAVATMTAASQTQYLKNRFSFTGVFRVMAERHVGNYRSPDGQAWITSFDLAQLPQAQTQKK